MLRVRLYDGMVIASLRLILACIQDFEAMFTLCLIEATLCIEFPEKGL